MKVVCTKKNLVRALGTTSRIIGSGSTLPILNNILMKTDQGRLKLSSTNLELAINTWVGGKIEEEGEITIPAKLINDYVNNIPAEKVSLSSTPKTQTLYLEAEKTQTHIKGLGAEEFPLIPQITEQPYAKLNGPDLRGAVEEVGFAASYSETQPEISGILFAFGGKELTLTATDRYRLAERKLNLLEEVEGSRQIIIPARAVNEVSRIVYEGIIEVQLTENQICFKTDEWELTSRLIEGQYPDYKQIVPTNFLTEAEVLRLELVQSLKGASLFATDSNNVEVELNPQGRQLVLKSQSAQIGDSEIRLDAAAFSGQKNQIIFNYRYLLECLNNLPDEKVILKVINSASPAALTPQGRENYFYIVMPIKI